MRTAAVHHNDAVPRDMHVELDEVAVIGRRLHEAHHGVLPHVPPLALASAGAPVPVEHQRCVCDTGPGIKWFF